MAAWGQDQPGSRQQGRQAAPRGLKSVARYRSAPVPNPISRTSRRGSSRCSQEPVVKRRIDCRDGPKCARPCRKHSTARRPECRARYPPRPMHPSAVVRDLAVEHLAHDDITSPCLRSTPSRQAGRRRRTEACPAESAGRLRGVAGRYLRRHENAAQGRPVGGRSGRAVPSNQPRSSDGTCTGRIRGRATARPVESSGVRRHARQTPRAPAGRYGFRSLLERPRRDGSCPVETRQFRVGSFALKVGTPNGRPVGAFERSASVRGGRVSRPAAQPSRPRWAGSPARSGGEPRRGRGFPSDRRNPTSSHAERRSRAVC